MHIMQHGRARGQHSFISLYFIPGPKKPTPPTNGGSSDTSIHLKWSPVSGGSLPITYTVCWGPTSLSRLDSRSSISGTSTTFNDLLTNTPYTFTVKALNEYIFSQQSDATTIATSTILV